ASASTAALGKLLPTERKDARHERGGMAGSGASRCYVWPAAVEIKSRIHGRSGSFACLGNRREYRDFSIAGCYPATRIPVKDPWQLATIQRTKDFFTAG